ncbi:MAG: N4-gp56 family major capsid protein [Oscillospiraceae bacterium]|nr:N4-gp56 family major capsid protein [Oscillospiraceae bacterium]
MAGGINLATKYIKEVDERWASESQAALVTGKGFLYKGDQTFVIYSIPYAPLNDYVRSGTNRYGTPNDLSRNIQTVHVTQDKSFAFTIDRGDEVQSEFVSNPGKSLAREIREVIVPAYDRYCFKVMVESAEENGHIASTEITKANAHAMLLNGVEHMSDRNVPIDNCYAFCTYHYANLLMQDPGFVRYGNSSQEMLKTGVIGMVDGIRIVMVSHSKLPAGTAFLLVHKDACVAPRQLEEYKTHEDPPGISGTLCEGRVLFDCFVLDEKADGIYYHGGQPVLKNLPFITSATNIGKTSIIMNCEKEKSTNKWFYITAEDHASLPDVVYGTSIDVSTQSSGWYGAVELTAMETEITPPEGHTRIKVVEVLRSMKPVGVSERKLNIG